MTDKNLTSMTLIQRIQHQNDDQCWEDFVNSYKGYIYMILRNFNIDSNICEDLLQQVFIKLWKALPNFKYTPDKCRFRTWLSQVSCNFVKDYLKSQAARHSSKETEYRVALHDLTKVSQPEIEKIAEKEWKLYIANKAWGNIKADLSVKVREIFDLSLNDISNKEIATKYDISENAVRVYLQRGRKVILREIYRLNKELDM